MYVPFAQSAGAQDTLRETYLVLRVSLFDSTSVVHPACIHGSGPFTTAMVQFVIVLVLSTMLYAAMVAHAVALRRLGPAGRAALQRSAETAAHAGHDTTSTLQGPVDGMACHE